jgi:hypothetical protein
MSAATDYLENLLIDHLFRGIQHTAPTDWYVALFTGAPSDAGGGTEITGGSYARVQVPCNSTNWRNTQNSGTGASSGTTGTTSNLLTVTFPVPSANWGTATHFALMTAPTGGSVAMQGALNAPKTINNSDPAPSFPAGTLTASLT